MRELNRFKFRDSEMVHRAFLLREEMIPDPVAKCSELNLKSFMRLALDVAEDEGTDEQRMRMYGCISMLAKHANELRDLEYGLKVGIPHPIEDLRKGKVQITFKVFDLIAEIKRAPKSTRP